MNKPGDALEFLRYGGNALVFDVEAIGLYGEAFAFGYAVVNKDAVLEKGIHACGQQRSDGLPEDREWVLANVPAMAVTCYDQRELREKFWTTMMRWRDSAIIAAECPWPVEANFLSACVRDDLQARKWEGPYPLYDISSILYAAGMNPLQTYPREYGELPVHNPLADALQSARLMLEAFRLIHGGELDQLERSG